MIQTNLATRPIYNERLVHLVLILAGVLVVGVSVANVSAIVQRSRQAFERERAAATAERHAGDMEREATRTQRESGGPGLEGLSAAALEANAVIEQRLFSWTEFFNRIEANLPPGVMVTAIRPTIDADGILISLAVVGRRIEALDTFMEQLEATGTFTGLLSRQEELTEQGMYRAVIEGRYDPTTAAAHDGEGSANGVAGGPG